MAKYQYTQIEKSVLRKMFLNVHFCYICFTMVKMEAVGFTMTMAPAIDELYKDHPEERKVALRRANNFFNTNTVPFAFIAGLTYALESEKMKKGIVKDDMIENIKAALMGPTAGIADSLMYNAFRVIIGGIAIGLGSQGNILGAFLFMLLFGGGQIVSRWYLLRLGYTTGTSFIDTVFETGLMGSVTKAASILGLTMVGAMVASMVSVNLAWIIDVGGAKVVVLDVFNSIMPGILSLVLVAVLVVLIKKGYKPINLVLGILFLSIFLAFFKVF